MTLDPYLDTSTNSFSSSAFDDAAEHPLLGTPCRKKWRLGGFANLLLPHTITNDDDGDDDSDDSSNHHWLSLAYREHNNASPIMRPKNIKTWTVDFSESSNSHNEEMDTIFESAFHHNPIISTARDQNECWNGGSRDEIELNGLSQMPSHWSDAAEVLCEDVAEIVAALMQSHARKKRECLGLMYTVAALVLVGLLWLWVV